MPVDRTVVLENARVWPAGDRLTVTGAVIGPEDAVGERIDLGGAAVVPGLVDAHVHFPSWALGRRELRLFGARSLGDALERIEAAEKPADGWLRGRGWREEEWPERDRPLRAAAECGVSFEEALASFTVAPAWLEGAEQRRGRLSEGFDADLVVLDGDRVRATMVAGRWVHGHPRAA
jgi:predicted amidohydrolase YtcJ